MFEHHKQKIITYQEFLIRIIFHIFIAIFIGAFSLFIGMCGYHYLEDLPWVDSLLNASMILSGMGPVDVLKTNQGKIFASFYALFSGIVFLVIMGIVIAPILHRFLHKFHIDDKV